MTPSRAANSSVNVTLMRRVWVQPCQVTGRKKKRKGKKGLTTDQGCFWGEFHFFLGVFLTGVVNGAHETNAAMTSHHRPVDCGVSAVNQVQSFRGTVLTSFSAFVVQHAHVVQQRVTPGCGRVGLFHARLIIIRPFFVPGQMPVTTNSAGDAAQGYRHMGSWTDHGKYSMASMDGGGEENKGGSNTKHGGHAQISTLDSLCRTEHPRWDAFRTQPNL